MSLKFEGKPSINTQDIKAKNEGGPKEKGDKYSKEYPKTPFYVDTVNLDLYTKQQKDEDLRHLLEWREHEIGRNQWLKEQLAIEWRRRAQIASDAAQRVEVRDWYTENMRFLNDQIQQIRLAYEEKYS